MIPPKNIDNEAERQRALDGYDLLDTPPEQAFDDLTHLIAKLLDVPIALVSLVDRDRQWFKSRFGIDATETPRDISFCGHSVADRELLLVSDATRDERFHDNPLVTADPQIRFYAGTPLIDAEGHALGTLCVIDRRPRKLSEEKLELLKAAGRQVMSQIDLRNRLATQHGEKDQLMETTGMQRAVLDAADFSIIATDEQGVITVFNHAAESWLGYRAEDIVGRQTPAVIHDPEEVVRRAAELSRLMGRTIEPGFEVFVARARQGHADENEWTYISSDGRRFPVLLSVTAVRDENDELTGFLGVAKDLSEQKAAEASRKRLEAEKSHFFSLNLDLLCIANPEGFFEQLNPAWEKTLGYSVDELLGRPFVDFIHPEDRDRTMAEASRLAEGGVTVEFENRYRTKDGRYLWLLWSAASNPEEGKLYAIARNITSRKRMEEMKNEFVSTVSHELRTPLTSIRGSLGLISGGAMGQVPEEMSALLEIATKNSERLVRLINDILDIEKIESGKMTFQMETLELGSLVEQALAANQGFAEEHNVRFELTETLERTLVRADSDRITQVLVNLLSNAAKFSPDGEAVQVSLERERDAIRCTVSDRGPGIPESFRERIFEKFAQADASTTREKGGTGLGLSICKAIVEKHDGTIGFESRAGSGTRFFFELPLLEQDQRALVEPTATDGVEESAPMPRVLVCEDDPDVAHLIQLMLRQAGFDTERAVDAREARQLLSSKSFDAATVDLMLPGEDGLSLIRGLRQEELTSKLPLIVVSAVADETRKKLQGSAVGIFDWLSKPVDGERLAVAIREATSGTNGQKPRILHVEDDADLSTTVAAILAAEAEVVRAENCADAKEKLSHSRFDLMLLDMGLPDGSGFEFLSTLKDIHPPIPVVVFSATEVSVRDVEGAQAALVKSRTSDEELRQVIKELIAS